MDATDSVSADQLTQMRACLDQLVSIIDLPGLSTGEEPAQIATAVMGALLGVLQLVFVSVRLSDSDASHPVEMVRVAESLRGLVQAGDVSPAIDSWRSRA